MTRAGGTTRRPRTLLQLDFRQPPALELFCLEVAAVTMDERRSVTAVHPAFLRELSTMAHCAHAMRLRSTSYRRCRRLMPRSSPSDPERTEEADRLMP